MESADSIQNVERQCKMVYERCGVFKHIATTTGEETQVPGRLVLKEVDGEAQVDWMPVKHIDSADDDGGWALVRQTSEFEIDEEYKHLAVNFKLKDVVSVGRAEAVMKLPCLTFEFSDEQTPWESIYFHSTQTSEFWQCLNRYLILARSPSEGGVYRVEGRTDELTKSLHGLNFSAEESQGIVSTFFSTGVEVLGGFSRVTQFMRKQLGASHDAGDSVDEMEEVHAPAVDSILPNDTHSSEQSVTASLQQQQVVQDNDSPLDSLVPRTTVDDTRQQSDLAERSIETTASTTVESLAATSCPLGSITGDSMAVDPDATPVSSVDREHCAAAAAAAAAAPTAAVIVTEPMSSVGGQSSLLQQRHTSSVDQAVDSSSSGTEFSEDLFQSAQCSVVMDEPSVRIHPVASPADDGDVNSLLSLQSAPGATLVDLDGYFRREEHVTMEEWKRHLTPSGHVQNVDRLRRRIFKGGISPDVRPIVWKFLLNYHDFNASNQEREQAIAIKREQYFALQQQWQTMFPAQLKRFTLMERRLEIIDKDVIRTDRTHPKYAVAGGPYLKSLESILRTYSIFNFDLGYVQGMSDLLSPILAVMDDEVDSFWCFSGLMDTVEDNFCEDMRGMRMQLEKLLILLRVIDPHFVQHLQKCGADNMFFCFRWLLVFFKREFPFDDVMRLWEVIWSRYLTPHFELFLAAAILTQQRQIIISKNMDGNDIITHINGLADQMDLDMMLIEAERLCRNVLRMPSNALPPEIRALFPPNGLLGEQDSSV